MNALHATTIFPSLCIATLSALLCLATAVVVFPESPKLVSRLPSAPYRNTVKQDCSPALNECPTTTIFPSSCNVTPSPLQVPVPTAVVTLPLLLKLVSRLPSEL